MSMVHSLGRRVCLSPQRPHRCPDSIESASCKICPYLVNVPEWCSQSQLKCLDQTHEGQKSTPKGWLLLWGMLLPSEPNRMQLLANYHILSLWQHHVGWQTAAMGFDDGHEGRGGCWEGGKEKHIPTCPGTVCLALFLIPSLPVFIIINCSILERGKFRHRLINLPIVTQLLWETGSNPGLFAFKTLRPSRRECCSDDKDGGDGVGGRRRRRGGKGRMRKEVKGRKMGRRGKGRREREREKGDQERKESG